MPGEKGIYEDRIQSDRTSSTEVPPNEKGASSGFAKGEGEHTKRKRFHMPGFLSSDKHEEKDVPVDNNGKMKDSDYKFTAWGQFRAVILGSWINVLLILCKYCLLQFFYRLTNLT